MVICFENLMALSVSVKYFILGPTEILPKAQPPPHYSSTWGFRHGGRPASIDNCFSGGRHRPPLAPFHSPTHRNNFQGNCYWYHYTTLHTNYPTPRVLPPTHLSTRAHTNPQKISYLTDHKGFGAQKRGLRATTAVRVPVFGNWPLLRRLMYVL